MIMGFVSPNYLDQTSGIYRAVRKGIEVLEEPGEEKYLPSLLGLEFLEELHFKLTCDMPTQAIFLEI
jgi:hypothetical protein